MRLFGFVQMEMARVDPSFATEPLVGSGTGGCLTTTAKREGDTWVLNGQKKWIGNAPWCDVAVNQGQVRLCGTFRGARFDVATLAPVTF